MTDSITVQAACHCGAFAFEFHHAPYSGPSIENKAKPVRCDCSICATRGYVFIYTYEKDLHIYKGSIDKLISYRYGENSCDHLFCGTCGSGIGYKDDGSEGRMGINLRYVKDVDVDRLDVRLGFGKDAGPGPAGRWDVFDHASKK